MHRRVALTLSLILGMVTVTLAASSGSFYVQHGNRMDYVQPGDPHEFKVKEWQMWYYRQGYIPNESWTGVRGMEVHKDLSELMVQHERKVSESCEARRAQVNIPASSTDDSSGRLPSWGKHLSINPLTRRIGEPPSNLSAEQTSAPYRSLFSRSKHLPPPRWLLKDPLASPSAARLPMAMSEHHYSL
jgi:hypothetical protein